MSELTVAVFMWNQGRSDEYTPYVVERFYRMFTPLCSVPHKIVCVSDRQYDVPVPCHVMPPEAFELGLEYPKLYAFSEEFHQYVGYGNYIFTCDLDCQVVDDVAPLVKDPRAELTVWRKRKRGPNLYVNSSNLLIKAGSWQHVYKAFDPEAMTKKEDPNDVENGYVRKWQAERYGFRFANDQVWIDYLIHNCPLGFSWTDFPPGIYQRDKPKNARIVHFTGRGEGRKPWHKAVHENVPWVTL